MKKKGLPNMQNSVILASLGHTDTVVIGDCGLPIPFGVTRVDPKAVIRTGEATPNANVILESGVAF